MIEIKKIFLLDQNEMRELDLSNNGTGLFLLGEDGLLYGGLSTDVITPFYDLIQTHPLYERVLGVSVTDKEKP